MRSAFGVTHTVSKANPQGILRAVKAGKAAKAAPKRLAPWELKYAGQAKYNAARRARS